MSTRLNCLRIALALSVAICAPILVHHNTAKSDDAATPTKVDASLSPEPVTEAATKVCLPCAKSEANTESIGSCCYGEIGIDFVQIFEDYFNPNAIIYEFKLNWTCLFHPIGAEGGCVWGCTANMYMIDETCAPGDPFRVSLVDVQDFTLNKECDEDSNETFVSIRSKVDEDRYSWEYEVKIYDQDCNGENGTFKQAKYGYWSR